MLDFLKELGISVKEIREINEIKELKETAAKIAMRRGHLSVEGHHLLLAILAFFKEYEIEVEKAKEVRQSVIDTLAQFNINGQKLDLKIKELFPSFENEKDTSVEYSEHILELFKNVEEKAKEEEREATALDIVFNFLTDIKDEKIRILFSGLGLNDSHISEFELIIKEKLQPLLKESNKGINKVDELEKYYGNYLTNLNRKVKNLEVVDVLGEGTNNKLEVVLSTYESKSAALIGPAGTGKTHAVMSFVKSINDKTCSPEFSDMAVYSLNIEKLTEDKMSFESKFQDILLAFAEQENAILFIDEFHALMNTYTLGASAADIMKPIMVEGNLKSIIATTDSEFSKYVKKDAAIVRRFHRINITEPTDEELKLILNKVIEKFDKYFNKKGSPELNDQVRKLAQKYSLDLANPAKAIAILDMAYANAKVNNQESEVVITEDVLESIRLKYGIRHIEEKTKETIKELNANILGQQEIIKTLAGKLFTVEKGLVDNDKPALSLILSGPTGVGKTETAKIIAKNFFGSEDNLIKLSMGEFKDSISVNKIIGSAPGYVGYDDETGLLSQVKNKPASVILFDEIEKAHPQVFDVLLNMLDAGIIQDQKGEAVSFREAIILFTTNLGYSSEDSETETVGFFNLNEGKINKGVEVKGALENHFRPEFLNRIDDIIVYNKLTDDIIEELIERYHQEFLNQFEGNKTLISKKFTAKELKKLKKESEIEKYGARGVKRAVRKILIEREFENLLLDEEFNFLKEK